MRKIVFFVCILLAGVAARPLISVDPKTNFFVDQFGRIRIFHGVNAVYKVFPYHPILDKFDPQESLAVEDINDLYSWGFNFVRLGTMWPGVETSRGQYNSTYLTQLQIIVEELAAKDIYVLLDCHQDVLSPKFCGEGVPDFAAIPSPGSLPFPIPGLGLDTLPVDNSTGYPKLDACLKNPFFKYYFSQAACTSFQNFYNNADGIQDAFVEFWKQVATAFKPYNNVIGYEILNEPWAGDIFSNFSLLTTPGLADKVNLVSLYEKVSAAIRNIDDDHLIFFEPTTMDSVWACKTGFQSVPGGSQYNNRSVLSYHVYCGLTNVQGDPFFRPLCDFIDFAFINAFVSEYKRIGGGGFLTEFGASYDDPAAIQQIHEMMHDADSLFQSWAWWQFKDFRDVTTASEGPLESFYDADGSLQLPKVKALSRTYASAISGLPIKMDFNPITGQFILQYLPNPTISQPTLIFLNQQFYYPKGFNVSLSSPLLSWKQTEPNRIQVYHSSSVSPTSRLQVVITALQ